MEDQSLREDKSFRHQLGNSVAIIAGGVHLLREVACEQEEAHISCEKVMQLTENTHQEIQKLRATIREKERQLEEIEASRAKG